MPVPPCERTFRVSQNFKPSCLPCSIFYILRDMKESMWDYYPGKEFGRVWLAVGDSKGHLLGTAWKGSLDDGDMRLIGRRGGGGAQSSYAADPTHDPEAEAGADNCTQCPRMDSNLVCSSEPSSYGISHSTTALLCESSFKQPPIFYHWGQVNMTPQPRESTQNP